MRQVHQFRRRRLQPRGHLETRNPRRNLWVADQVQRKQFDVKWHPGQENLGDYYTKHHPASHHARVRPIYLHEPNSPLELPRAMTPEELRGCAKTPMALPTSRQPLSFPFSQHSRSRTEGTSPIGAAAAAAITYRDISLSPFSCHQMPAAALCPWPAAISCS